MEEIFKSVAPTLLAMIASTLLGYVSSKYRQLKIENEAIRDGLQAMLRDKLLGSCEYYISEKGWCTPRSAENLHEMYKAYKNLGGNGMITDVFSEFQKLPHFPPKKD